ncbi:hypothetical protein [Acetobacter sp.]|uniref:hypothetical protein n=1 Tax=Acetobacter sp. TaxID=440 RepID=UPI0039E85835
MTACTEQALVTMPPIGGGKLASGLHYYLPMAYVPITITGGSSVASGKEEGIASTDADTYRVSITVNPTVYVANPDEPLFLAWHHSGWTEDDIDLKVGSDGLLQNTNVISDDKTGDIAKKTVEILGEVAKLAGGVPTTRTLIVNQDKGKRINCRLPSISKTVSFFPDEKYDLVSIKRADSTQKIDIQLHPEKILSKTDVEKNTFLQEKHDGIVFRRPFIARYTLTVTPNPEAEQACGISAQKMSFSALVPDRSPDGLFREEVSRKTLVKRTTNLAISNGMLSEVKLNSPSNILAYVSLPVDLLKAIAAIPASVLTFRIEQIEAAKGVTAAEATAIEAQIDLLAKKAALQAASAAEKGE